MGVTKCNSATHYNAMPCTVRFAQLLTAPSGHSLFRLAIDSSLLNYLRVAECNLNFDRVWRYSVCWRRLALGLQVDASWMRTVAWPVVPCISGDVRRLPA